MGEKPDTEDRNPSEHLREASNSLLNALSSFSSTVENLLRWLWFWFEDHPVVRWFVLLPIGWIVIQGLLEFVGRFSIFFFGAVIPTSRDIQVETHPIPIGLSLNILFLLWILTTFAAYRRIAILRRRIEILEATTGGES